MSISMISPRDYVLRTRSGHTIAFKANTPRRVPPECVSEAMAVNILPVEVKPELGDSPAGYVKTHVTGTLREALVLNAIVELVRENDSSNFNAGGQPKVHALNAATGLKLSGSEVSKYWDRYREIQSTNSPMPKHPRMEQVLELQTLTTRKQLVEYASEIGIPENEVTRRTVKEAKEVLMNATINHVEPLAEAPATKGTLVED